MLEEKKLHQAILRGAQLMIDNGLGDWTLKLQNKRSALADCDRTRKTIRYSKHFIRVATPDQFDGVTFHEITHALLPKGTHHGPEFVKKCIEISPNADYAKRSVNVNLWKFDITCPECGTKGGSNKKKLSLCRVCHENGKTSHFVYKEALPIVTVW